VPMPGISTSSTIRASLLMLPLLGMGVL
jgi:hypothetical protein